MNTRPHDWTLIAAFLAVMRTGSLSAAARALALTQPTLRSRISELETLTGTPLFVRGPTGLTPTAAARSLLPDAEAMDAAGHVFYRRAATGGHPLAGVIRIAASEVTGTEVLPFVLAPFLRDNPSLRIELDASNGVTDLLRCEADLAVRHSPPQQGALVARQMPPVPLGFYASDAYLAHHGSPQDWAELAAAHPFVSDDRRGWMEAGFSQYQATPPDSTVWKTDFGLSGIAAVRAGIGIGLIQVPVAQRLGLTRVLPSFSTPLPVWIVMHGDMRGNPRVRAVFDVLVAAYLGGLP